MAIETPGYRQVRGRLQNFGTMKKTVVVALSLTAMVDLFTVMTIFLLQNYNQDSVILDAPKEVSLPQAKSNENVQPVNLITITEDTIYLGKEAIVQINSLKSQRDWLIPELYSQIKKDIENNKIAEENKPQINKIDQSLMDESQIENLTVYADQNTEILVIKKVMYTANLAGAKEVSFAVTKK